MLLWNNPCEIVPCLNKERLSLLNHLTLFPFEVVHSSTSSHGLFQRRKNGTVFTFKTESTLSSAFEVFIDTGDSCKEDANYSVMIVTHCCTSMKYCLTGPRIIS